MKKPLFLLPLLFIFITLSGFDTLPAKQIIPTPLEIGVALKEALSQGTTKSVVQLSAVDGFFGNPAIKIVFPPEAQKAESTLRKLGENQLCDNIILSLNRAAEDAAKQAEPIFIGAIKQMTFNDIMNILLGAPDAATQYFKRTTTPSLIAQFRPVIQNSLDKVGATKFYSDAARIHNKIPFVHKINPDLADYVTQKAIDGLFFQIAIEELNIRQHINARPSPVMQRVFLFAEKNRKF